MTIQLWGSSENLEEIHQHLNEEFMGYGIPEIDRGLLIQSVEIFAAAIQAGVTPERVIELIRMEATP